MLELLEEGQDPTAANSERHTPYAVAPDKGTRDVFRRYMGSNPEQWDWHEAGVPSALTPDVEAHQAAKQVIDPTFINQIQPPLTLPQLEVALVCHSLRLCCPSHAGSDLSNNARIADQRKLLRDMHDSGQGHASMAATL